MRFPVSRLDCSIAQKMPLLRPRFSSLEQAVIKAPCAVQRHAAATPNKADAASSSGSLGLRKAAM